MHPVTRAVLDIFDLETGKATLLLASDLHIEAPNWAPDGRALFVNGAGRLYRVPLDHPALHPIPCEGLVHLNNDHGISPDGRTMAVSNSPGRGTSLVYTLPATGGTPVRITETAPSWWHGWSPDGRRIAYTCIRNGQFGIATCPAEGGTETLLIGSAHHYDGPDYTPDGAWIWFNSDRGGQMDLWRVRPDGTDPEQMTRGVGDAWFPHPSPDGRHVLYLAYPAGTDGHPFGLTVTLNLMPATGGSSRILTTLFGGQGTLNVPCWAPDSRRFAYVRYADTN